MFVFRLKTLNFLLLLFLLFCIQKRTNVQKVKASELGKPSVIFFNFLSILNVPINLNFVRARFEFHISWLNSVLKP